MKPFSQNPHVRLARTLCNDWKHNLTAAKHDGHILIVRDLYNFAHYNNHFLHWVRENFPAASRRIRLARISKFPIDLNGTRLIVPWLQDPLKEGFPVIYRRAMELQARARTKGIPIVNPVETLSNSIKSHALATIRGLGVRTAMTVEITDAKTFVPEKHGLPFPFFVRENCGHGGVMHLVNRLEEVRQIPWEKFTRPVAMEFIDVRDPDGNCRKYRYIMIGEEGFPRHLIITESWCAHASDRALTADAYQEEKRYLETRRDPNHDLFNRARQALGLDTVAFDFSYDQKGKLMIWEPNPFPVFWAGGYGQDLGKLQWPAMERIYRSLLLFFLHKAGMEDVI